MATILLSAAGAAIGGSVGGTLAGLSSVAVGRAIGATFGRIIDQRLLGQGSDSVETGKVERFRLTQASDGAPIPQVYGRMRIGGQVIWASHFQETSTTSGGGKGAPSAPKTTRYSYSVSLAIALCEGEISTVGRIWADGEELARDDLNLRIYVGTRDQLPDPAIEAVEGPGVVPAYRGTAYVVIEDLDLGPYGNRLPSLSFEVIRAAQVPGHATLQDAIRGVAWMPGSGEYAYATDRVLTVPVVGGGQNDWNLGAPSGTQAQVVNANSPSGQADFTASLDALQAELPRVGSGLLIASWFGDDLRCGTCTIAPKVDQIFFPH